MASNIAIIASAISYSFILDQGIEGVVLEGQLGKIAIWENGVVENMPVGDMYSTGYTEELNKATSCAYNWLPK